MTTTNPRDGLMRYISDILDWVQLAFTLTLAIGFILSILYVVVAAYYVQPMPHDTALDKALDHAISQAAAPRVTTGIAQDMAAILAERGINTTTIIYK